MAQVRSGSISARRRLGGHPQPTRFWDGSPAATLLDEVSRARADTALRMLASDPRGLSEVEVQRRLRTYGPNEVAHERPVSWPTMLLHNFKNPFVVVLAVLGLVSYVTEDTKGTIVVAVMVALSVLMRFIQEFRSSRAAQVLRAMVSTTATVTRRYTSGSEDGAGEIVSQKREILGLDRIDHGDRHWPALLSCRGGARNGVVAVGLLLVAGRDPDRLLRTHPDRQGLVSPAVRIMALVWRV